MPPPENITGPHPHPHVFASPSPSPFLRLRLVLNLMHYHSYIFALPYNLPQAERVRARKNETCPREGHPHKVAHLCSILM